MPTARLYEAEPAFLRGGGHISEVIISIDCQIDPIFQLLFSLQQGNSKRYCQNIHMHSAEFIKRGWYSGGKRSSSPQVKFIVS